MLSFAPGIVKYSQSQSLEGTFKTNMQRPLLQAPLFSEWLRTFTVSGVLKQNWSMKVPTFQEEVAHRQLIIFQPPKRSLGSAIWGFGDSILHHARHLEEGGSHLSIQNNKSICVTKRVICAASSFSILYGQHFVGFRVLTSNPLFWWLCLSHIIIFNRWKQSCLEHRKAKTDSRTWITTQKVLFYSSVLANGVVDP